MSSNTLRIASSSQGGQPAAPAQQAALNLRSRLYTRLRVQPILTQKQKKLCDLYRARVVTESERIAGQQEERARIYVPVSGDLSDAARYLGGDITGYRWFFSFLENAKGRTDSILGGVVGPTADGVSQAVTLIAAASSVDSALGAAAALYGEFKNPNSGFNQGFFNTKVKVARLAMEILYDGVATSYRTVSVVQMYHNSSQVAGAAGLLGTLFNICAALYFLIMGGEFASKWSDSNKLLSILEQKDAKERLAMAAKVTPYVYQAMRKWHEEYNAEKSPEKKLEALGKLSALLKYVTGKENVTFDDMKIIEEAYVLNRYIAEIAPNQANNLFKEINARGVTNARIEMLKTKANSMCVLAFKIVFLLTLGMGVLIFSTVSGVPPAVVTAISCAWLVFNMAGFAIDYKDFKDALNNDELKIGTLEKRMAFVRYFLMLSAIILSLYFGTQFSAPGSMELLIADAAFMFCTSTWVFMKTCQKIHRQNKKEAKSSEQTPLLAPQLA